MKSSTSSLFKKIKNNPFVIERIIYLIILLILVVVILMKPTNSIELYNELAFAEDYSDVEKLILDGHEKNFTEEDLQLFKEKIKLTGDSNSSIIQYTVLSIQDSNEMTLIETTPGTRKFYIRDFVEVPAEVRDFIKKQRLSDE